MNCPACNHKDTRKNYEIRSFLIMECNFCRHGFTDLQLTPEKVKEIYSDQCFYGVKDGYPDYTLEKDILIKRGEKYARVINKYTSPGLLLDVGAAAGFIMKGFENTGWETIGIEPNNSIAEFGRKNLNMNIKSGTIETIELEKNFDLILLIQVIAHLYDLNTAIYIISEKLKKGGYLLVETWDKNSISARLLGSGWHEYSPPSTLNFFSKKSLDTLMGRYGLKKVATGRLFKKIHSEHAKSLLNHKLGESKNLRWAKGITKLIPKNVSFPYPSEDLFWSIYGKTRTYEK